MTKEKLHIIPHDHKLGREDRNRMNGHESFVVWFVGLSGSGKSTLADALEQRLYERGVHTYLLDGDNVRAGLNSDLDFSVESRIENIRRIGELANLFVDAGLVTISAFISPLEADRQKARSIVGTDKFIEVYVECPIEVCEQRDVKGLYAKARAGEISNFTGINSPFEAPQNPEILVNTAENSLEECLDKILEEIERKL
jgi:adenylylsulfate kinase